MVSRAPRRLPPRTAARIGRSIGRAAGLWGLLMFVAVPALAKKAPPAGPSCPATISGQYDRVTGLSADGTAGSIEGLTPVFLAPAALRLVSAQLALAHGVDRVPSELLPPDGLVITPGRPMKWTLWSGELPEPVALVHIVCEYEGGLMLHRLIGRTVRSCTLDTQLQKAAGKARGAGAAQGSSRATKDAAPEGKGKAAVVSTPAASRSLRPVLTRAVFSCR